MRRIEARRSAEAVRRRDCVARRRHPPTRRSCFPLLRRRPGRPRRWMPFDGAIMTTFGTLAERNDTGEIARHVHKMRPDRWAGADSMRRGIDQDRVAVRECCATKAQGRWCRRPRRGSRPRPRPDRAVCASGASAFRPATPICRPPAAENGMSAQDQKAATASNKPRGRQFTLKPVCKPAAFAASVNPRRVSSWFFSPAIAI